MLITPHARIRDKTISYAHLFISTKSPDLMSYNIIVRYKIKYHIKYTPFAYDKDHEHYIIVFLPFDNT